MGFNLESGKHREINETPPEVKVDSEQLSKTEETAENFDDCSLNEIQDSKGNEVNAESLEEAEENYDDCEAKMEEMEEKNLELAEEDDDFNDCGKETDGQYVAEVTYTTDGKISQEEASVELQEAYNECDDPEDMQQLKENANENEHIEVHNAEVIERPENAEIESKISEEYEQAQEELEEAQEALEAQQEAAQEYKDDLENQINKQENEVQEGTENIDNDASENTEETPEDIEATEEESENTEAGENTDEADDSNVEEKPEDDNESGEDIKESNEAEDEVNKETQEVESDSEQVEEGTEDINETTESSDDSSEDVDENVTSSEVEGSSNDVENVESDDLKQMDSDTDIEASSINEETAGKDISKKIAEETDTELSDETKEKTENDVSESIENEAEDGKISAERTEEIIKDNVEENVDKIEEQEADVDEMIDNRTDEIVENEDLSDEEAKEQIYDEISESSNENLSDEEIEAIAEEKADDIDEAIEEKKDEKESIESVEKTAEELENDQVEQSSEKEAKSLQERIDGAFDKDEVSADEINDLREENASELKSKLEEKEATEAALKNKFDEVLSKEKGSDEYKQALQEYNALQDQKASLNEQLSAMEKQQDLLDKKSIELREAQIQKGAEAVAASAATLAGVDALQERYNQTYYDRKPDKTELASIREESCSTIKELTDEKDSIRRAMDAKMDEISEYVTSNNMDRYDTVHDLRYQQFSAEYNAMKESYDRIGYSIVKLDENNKAISEHIGDEYVSMVELAPSSAISEVNEGIDVPGETNYFIDEAKAAEILYPFKQEKWEQLSVQEQKRAVEKLTDYNAEILGVEDKPRIVYYNADDPCNFGGYSAKQNAIYINEYNMKDATETADTISHEYRHKYQHERAEKLETERDLEFKEGFDNYIRAEDDYQGYKEQLVESDAWTYAQAVKDKIAASSDIGNENNASYAERSSFGTEFVKLNPEKGTVFEKVSIEELPEDFEQKDGIVYKEVLEPHRLKLLKHDELDLLRLGSDAINQRLEFQADDYRDKGMSENEIRDRLAADKWNFQKEFLEDAFPGQDVSPNVFNGFNEHGAKDRIDEIERSPLLRETVADNKDKYEAPAVNSAFNEKSDIPIIPRISDINREVVSLFPEHRQKAIDEAFADTPNELIEAINEKVEGLHHIQDSGYRQNDEGVWVKDGCYYTDGSDTIVMDEHMTDAEYAEVFPHELGHFMDCQRGWESTKAEFTAAINEDIASMDKSTPEGRMRFYDMLDDAFSTGAAYDRNVSDILSAIFANDPDVEKRFFDESVAYYKHDDEYWQTLGMRQKEIYANCMAIQVGQSRIAKNFIERWFGAIDSDFKNKYNIRS